jgi:hypothetical protein
LRHLREALYPPADDPPAAAEPLTLVVAKVPSAIPIATTEVRFVTPTSESNTAVSQSLRPKRTMMTCSPSVEAMNVDENDEVVDIYKDNPYMKAEETKYMEEDVKQKLCSWKDW